MKIVTNKIEVSSQEIGKLSVKKLENWLKTSPTIPIHNRKMNKAKICRMHGITISTRTSNSSLVKLFADNGPIALLVQEQLNNEIHEQPSSANETKSKSNDTTLPTEELTKKIDELKQAIDSIHLDLASEEYLTSTGRYVPKLYLKNFED